VAKRPCRVAAVALFFALKLATKRPSKALLFNDLYKGFPIFGGSMKN
jgi:hypothetical protein